MWRLSTLMTPTGSERVVQKTTVVNLIYRVGKELERRPIFPDNPMSTAIHERGTVPSRVFRRLVDAPAAGEEDESLSRVEGDKSPDIISPKNASTAPPTRIQETTRDDTSSRVLPCDIFEPRRDSSKQARATEG